jgi:hypothetical protein
MPNAIDYLNPDLPANHARVTMRVIDATAATLEGYGFLVDDPTGCKIEIVRWPAQGTRPVDADTGDQGGTTEGTFISEWKGDILRAQRGRRRPLHLAYGEDPERADPDHARSAADPVVACEHHPDGGQLFFPLDRKPFWSALRCRVTTSNPRNSCASLRRARRLYIHPNIWHEGVFATAGTQRFFDQQGAVHARVSVDFAREFGCLLEAPIG